LLNLRDLGYIALNPLDLSYTFNSFYLSDSLIELLADVDSYDMESFGCKGFGCGKTDTGATTSAGP
jgi:hypothetical protein